MGKQAFVQTIAPYVKKYAPSYGIACCSAIIAQACLESGYGSSSLAHKYHNYFGMKCGSSWKGKSVNMSTKEEYEPGTMTNIRANFRVYDSMDEGVKGYFDFISTSRYANLKGVRDPETYLNNIKADGYATSSAYVTTCMQIVRDRSLISYDGIHLEGCSVQNYKQNDSRWASKAYAGETMAVAGCGPTAVANIVGSTPDKVADYITSKGGASNGHGTYWGAIDTALDGYGYNGQQLNGSSLYGKSGSSAEQKWKQAMLSGAYYGILLMGKGVFCNSGHYITITEYDGSRCYVHDPAYAPRDGWHAWADFDGCVKIFYLADKAKGGEASPVTDDTTYSFSPEQVSLGSTGKSVELLQKILKSRGFYTGEIDGSYGSGTHAAVTAYQTARKGFLSVDGVCGPNTWTDLLGMAKSGGKYHAEQISAGSTGEAVLLAQEILTAEGLYSMGLDKTFGGGTDAAVRKYQTQHGLTADGVVGPATWKAMVGL